MLSQILQKTAEFTCSNRQLYTKSSELYIDLEFSSLTNKMYFFLYCLHLVADDIASVSIVNDVEESESLSEILLTAQDYAEIEPLLPDYGVITENYQAREKVCTVKFLTLSDCKAGIVAADEIFVTDIHTVQNQEALLSFLKTWENEGHKFTVWNATVSQYNLQNEMIGKRIFNNKDVFILDGSFNKVSDKFIFWMMCRTADSNTVTTHEYMQLYHYLADLPQSVICIRNSGLVPGTNTPAEQQAIQEYMQVLPNVVIPERMISLLAILHLVNGKHIEFLQFAIEDEERFLKQVCSMYNRKIDGVSEQLKFFDNVSTDKLYLIKQGERYQPAVIANKHCNVDFVACSIVSTLRSIRELQTYPGNYNIPIGSGDFSSSSVITSEDIALTDRDVRLFSLAETVSILESVAEPTSVTAFENYIYKLLRYLEQKLYGYTFIASMANLICFEYHSSLYIGIARIERQYDVTAYFCTTELYTYNTVVSEVLPTSVIYPEDLDADIMHCIEKATGLSLKVPQEKLELQEAAKVGLLSTKYISTSDDIVYAVLNRFYLRDNLYSRVYDWDKLTKIFTSYGLRDLDTRVAPLTIYGGCNVRYEDRHAQVIVYPITVEDCPYREETI